MTVCGSKSRGFSSLEARFPQEQKLLSAQIEASLKENKQTSHWHLWGTGPPSRTLHERLRRWDPTGESGHGLLLLQFFGVPFCRSSCFSEEAFSQMWSCWAQEAASALSSATARDLVWKSEQLLNRKKTVKTTSGGGSRGIRTSVSLIPQMRDDHSASPDNRPETDGTARAGGWHGPGHDTGYPSVTQPLSTHHTTCTQRSHDLKTINRHPKEHLRKRTGGEEHVWAAVRIPVPPLDFSSHFQ